MPLSTADAMASYGFVYQLAEAVPALKTFIDQAITDTWTPERLTATVESSDWWRSNADTVRNLVQLQATDPATYQRTLLNATDQVILKTTQLGRQIDMPTATALALRTLTENASWDDNRLTNLVAGVAPVQHAGGGAYVNNAAQLADHMTQVAQNYGVPYTQDSMDYWLNAIQLGRDSLDGFESQMRARAKAQYPHFANQIDAGVTIRDIADPYIAQYAKTLEVPETDVTLKDPAIARALQQTGQDGQTQTSMPMWQFTRALKDDPRYDKTAQAKDDAYSTLAKVGKDFGFVGGGA